MSTIRTQFGPVNNFAITLNGLAAGAARSSAKVENQDNRYVDAICQFKVRPWTGSLGDRYAVYLFAWGAADDGSPIYPAGVTGVDEAVGVQIETLSLRQIGSLYVSGVGTIVSPPFRNSRSIFPDMTTSRPTSGTRSLTDRSTSSGSGLSAA